MSAPTTDNLMSVTKLEATNEPQRLIWLAMHTCYSPKPEITCNLSEYRAGQAVVDHLLKGNKGHWSPLEQAHISLHLAYVPHDLMQQLTRHRLLSFSVQSFRYTSKQFEDYNSTPEYLNRLVYFRQADTRYVGRDGSKYEYTREMLFEDMATAHMAIQGYQRSLVGGMSPEHARGLLPFNIRQHLVAGGNLRAWLHVLDLRLKADAQPEIQQLCAQVTDVLSLWCPQVLQWYKQNRSGKALLSP